MAGNITLPLTLLITGVLVGGIYMLSYNNIAEDKNVSSTAKSVALQHPSKVDSEQNLASARDIAELRQALDNEIQNRASIIDKLNELEKQIKTLSEQRSPNTSNSIDLNKVPPASNLLSNQDISNTGDRDKTDTAPSTEAVLLAYGFNRNEITELKSRQDRLDLDKLYLQDQATRENWINTPRYREELSKLDQPGTLRQQLGDERYDQYLFATGELNRVTIEQVMIGSAAEQVGLLPGDNILSYDNNRIFSWSEIREATQQGLPGESATITLERDGQRYHLSIPRGPLGVRLNMARVPPS